MYRFDYVIKYFKVASAEQSTSLVWVITCILFSQSISTSMPSPQAMCQSLEETVADLQDRLREKDGELAVLRSQINFLMVQQQTLVKALRWASLKSLQVFTFFITLVHLYLHRPNLPSPIFCVVKRWRPLQLSHLLLLIFIHFASFFRVLLYQVLIHFLMKILMRISFYTQLFFSSPSFIV